MKNKFPKCGIASVLPNYSEDFATVIDFACPCGERVYMYVGADDSADTYKRKIANLEKIWLPVPNTTEKTEKN